MLSSQLPKLLKRRKSVSSFFDACANGHLTGAWCFSNEGPRYWEPGPWTENSSIAEEKEGHGTHIVPMKNYLLWKYSQALLSFQ